MKINDYIHKTRDELVSFEFWWRKQRRADPEKFPLEMDEAEWDEQLTFYCQSVGSETK